MAAGCCGVLQKAWTDSNATKPSTTERRSTTTLDPLLYPGGVGLLILGDGVICAAVGVGVAGDNVDGTVDDTFGREALTGAVGGGGA
jgi:uncharacterized protein GlcG (DUF336 family)